MGKRGPRPTPPIERIFARLDDTSDPDACWLFTGSLGSHGYGQINVDQKPELVHRIVYEYFFGPLEDDEHVDHECHNRDLTCPGGPRCWHRPCCNPNHLDASTPGENREAADEPRQRAQFATHCPNGHEWNDENTGWLKRGARGGTGGVRGKRAKYERYCKVCARERMAMRKLRARK